MCTSYKLNAIEHLNWQYRSKKKTQSLMNTKRIDFVKTPQNLYKL